MKQSLLFGLFWILASALAHGAIPQLINYQGLLLEENGSKVTGIKSISLKVFTGATDGNGTKEIYQENVGSVSVTDGLYAFNFGGTGLSVISTHETVGTGDGSTQIFNYTVDNAPVLDGTAVITKYVSKIQFHILASWSQTDGSSDPSFISSVVNSTGAVSVTNASGAPATVKSSKLATITTVLVSWEHSHPTQPPGLKSVWTVPPPSPPTLSCGSFANVAGTIQGENLSVDPVSGNVIVKNRYCETNGSVLAQF